MTGIILAGGLATRMGGINKAFIEVDGERLIDRTLRVYRPLFSEIIIVTNSPLEFLEYDCRIVTDLYERKGPIGGIHAGLFHATEPHAFVTACDMPRLNEAFIRYMLEQVTPDTEVIVPVIDGQYEPLHAIYSRACLPVIESHIERDDLKVARLFRRFHLQEIPAQAIRRFDPEGLLFSNLNRPEDVRGNTPGA